MARIGFISRAWKYLFAWYALALIGSLGIYGPIPAFLLWSALALLLAALTWRHRPVRPTLRRRTVAAVGFAWLALLLVCGSAPWWLPAEGLLPIWLLTLACVTSVTEIMRGALRADGTVEAGEVAHG